MPLVNGKVVFKLKNCNLAAAGVDSVNANDYNIMFTMKDTNLYVPVVTLSAKCNQKLLKLLSKGSERSVYWNKCKTKGEKSNSANRIRLTINKWWWSKCWWYTIHVFCLTILK